MRDRDRRPPGPRCWEYTLPRGFRVFAGKTEADNEALCLRVARANDFWLHAKGLPGSPVIPRIEDVEPDRRTPERAAAPGGMDGTALLVRLVEQADGRIAVVPAPESEGETAL